MVGEDRVKLSPRVPKTRMLALHHTPVPQNLKATKRHKKHKMICASLWLIGAPGETRTHNPLLKRQVPWSNLATDALSVGGTERTRTVIGLIDNQVPNLSATVPCVKFGWVEGS